MAKVNFKITGMKELQKSLKALGEVPQKHVTAAAKKGMNIPLQQAKSKAPIDTGMLRKGMKLIGEKNKTKGKKVYQIVFDRDFNDIFQKRNKSGQIIAYYPVSQEYGYFTKNGRYIPGYRFIHGSLENNAPRVQQVIIGTIKQKIDAEIAKRGLK